VKNHSLNQQKPVQILFDVFLTPVSGFIMILHSFLHIIEIFFTH